MRTIEDFERSSLLYWYPKIEKLNIPMPMTMWYEIPKETMRIIQEADGIPRSLVEKVKPLAKEIGYPLFMKADQAAGKHGWKKSCYVESEADLQSHIFEVIEANMNADIIGLPIKALVFRNYIPLYSKFVAFGGDLPISKERRYFIRDGKVECHHPYWPEQAIAEWSDIVGKRSTLPANWKELLAELNKEDEEETELLKVYAKKVGKVLAGWWSVDFACANTGDWFLIDMAVGAASFHWLDCKHCPQEMRDIYTKAEETERPGIVEYIDRKSVV